MKKCYRFNHICDMYWKHPTQNYQDKYGVYSDGKMILYVSIRENGNRFFYESVEANFRNFNSMSIEHQYTYEYFNENEDYIEIIETLKKSSVELVLENV